MEDNVIESLLVKYVLFEHENNIEIYKWYKTFSSKEMLDELNA